MAEHEQAERADEPAFQRSLRLKDHRDAGKHTTDTKTLAKLGNHCAKKNLAGEDGVCDFAVLDKSEYEALLASLPVEEIWGVGRKLTARLNEVGIRTVQQLRDADAATLRRQFSVVLERTIMELRGVSCMELEEVAPAKQQIISSRSFGAYVTTLPGLEEAVATYIARAAEKLRAPGGLASERVVCPCPTAETRSPRRPRPAAPGRSRVARASRSRPS